MGGPGDRVWPQLRRLTSGRWWQIAAVAAASIAAGLAEAGFLVLVTRLGFAISDGADTIELLGEELTTGTAVGVATAGLVVRVLTSAVSGWVGSGIVADVSQDMRSRLAWSYLASDWPTKQQHRSGELQQLLTGFTQAAGDLVGNSIVTLISVLNLTALLIVALVVNPTATIAVVGGLLVLSQAIRPLRSALRRQSELSAQASLQYAGVVQEVDQVGLEVEVFGVQNPMGERVTDLITWQTLINRRSNFLRTLIPNVYTGLAYLAILLTLGAIAAGDGVSLTSVGAVMLTMLRALSYGQVVQTSRASVIAAMPYLLEVGRRQGLYSASHREPGQACPETVLPLKLEQVDFEYLPGQPVIRGVDLVLERGDVVGLVGPSGAGKSTLVQLILGLRQPTGGRVVAGGVPLAQIDRSGWVRRVTFVPQRATLIAGTVAENIRFFRQGVSAAEIERAAVLANLHGDVTAWPERYERQVGDGGSNLSGGQQQRLCIARALVEKPDVLVLDEPTSALDAASEELVRSALDSLREHTAIVIIAHRPSTLEICNRMLRVDQQQVLEIDRGVGRELIEEIGHETDAFAGAEDGGEK